MLVGVYVGTATMENIMEGPQKIKNRTLYDPAIPFESLFERKKKKNTNSKRHVNSHVMLCYLHQFSSVQFSRSVVFDSLRPHE